MRKLKSQKGFTLIELMMVVVILGVLGAVAIPIFADLSPQADAAAEQGVVGGVRAGITTYFVDPSRGNFTNYPPSLDGASNGTCNTANACFTTVLAQGGMTDGQWTKASATTYTGPNGTTYTYTAASGNFV